MASRLARTGAVATALLASPLIAHPGESATVLEVEVSAAEAMYGSIGRTVALPTDLDGRLDVAAIVGDDIVVLTGPDPCQYSVALGMSGVTAMGTLPNEGGGPDRLLVAHSAGLSMVQRDPADPRGFTPLFSNVGGSAWIGARSVLAMDVDGDGDLDVVALDATGSNLLSLAQASDGTFSVQAPVALGVELSHLVEAPWGLSVPTLAASMTMAGVGDDSLVIIGVGGVLHASYTPGGAIDDIVHLTDEVNGAVGVAALSGGGLTVLRPNGVVEATLPMDALAPTSLGAADVDGDGRTDVLLNSTIAPLVKVLMHQGSGATFKLSISMQVDLGSDGMDMSGQLANPIGADFDRDGDIDIFQMVEASRDGRLQRGMVVDEAPMQAAIESDLWIFDPSGSAVALTIKIPQMPLGGSPDMLEVVVYTSDPGVKKNGAQSMRGFVHVDVSGNAVGEVISVWLPYAGELGFESSIGLRCYDLDASGTVMVDCGVENAKEYELIEGGGTEGTGSGIGWTGRRQTGRGRIPPPRPPVPIGA